MRIKNGCVRSGDMLLTGYHGTSQEAAEIIMESKQFLISNKNKEWIGKGIYFYPNINDAYEWNDCEAILHVVIKVEQSEYLDIDTKEGQKIYNEIENVLLERFPEMISEKPQENQCAVMNLLWNTYDDIKVVSASFATKRTLLPTLIDTRRRRKEVCVRSNNSIKVIQIIRKGDLDD